MRRIRRSRSFAFRRRACSSARRLVINTLEGAIFACTDYLWEHLAAASLDADGAYHASTAAQRRIVGDRVLKGASCHWWPDFAGLVILAGPDAFVTVALDLGMDRSIGAFLIFKSADIIANFHRWAFASSDWSYVLLELATLEGLACDLLVGFKPDRILVISFLL